MCLRVVALRAELCGQLALGQKSTTTAVRAVVGIRYLIGSVHSHVVVPYGLSWRIRLMAAEREHNGYAIIRTTGHQPLVSSPRRLNVSWWFCSRLFGRDHINDSTPRPNSRAVRPSRGSNGRLCNCIGRPSSFKVAWTQGFVPGLRLCVVQYSESSIVRPAGVVELFQ